MKVDVAQSCRTLCDPMGYTVHEILQTRILEWVAFPFSRGSSQPRDQTQVSHMAGGFFTSWATRETHGRRIDTCIPMAESLYCPPETITVLLLAMKVKVKSLSRVQLFRPRGLYSPWNSPGQNTGVGSLSLRQGIFPTQGSNPGLLPCRWIRYQLSHQGNPDVPQRSQIQRNCKRFLRRGVMGTR